MTRLFGVCVLALVVASPAFAQQKSCPELAAEIAERLDAKGIKGYQLDIVPAGEVGDKQVVGSCDAGTKKITYRRDVAAQSAK